MSLKLRVSILVTLVAVGVAWCGGVTGVATGEVRDGVEPVSGGGVWVSNLTSQAELEDGRTHVVAVCDTSTARVWTKRLERAISATMLSPQWEEHQAGHAIDVAGWVLALSPSEMAAHAAEGSAEDSLVALAEDNLGVHALPALIVLSENEIVSHKDGSPLFVREAEEEASERKFVALLSAWLSRQLAPPVYTLSPDREQVGPAAVALLSSRHMHDADVVVQHALSPLHDDESGETPLSHLSSLPESVVVILYLDAEQFEGARQAAVFTHRHHAHKVEDHAPDASHAFVHVASLLRHEAGFGVGLGPHDPGAEPCGGTFPCVVLTASHVECGKHDGTPSLGVHVYSGDLLTPRDLRAWLEIHLHPAVGVMDGYNRQHYNAMGIPLFLYFTSPPKNSPHIARDEKEVARVAEAEAAFLDIFLSVAKTYRGRVAFAIRNESHARVHARHLGLNPRGPWPALALEDHPEHWAYPARGWALLSETTPRSLSRFITRALDGSLPPTIVSAPAPVSQPHPRHGAVVVVGSTFDSLVLASPSPFLLLLCHPASGHTKTLLNTFNKVSAIAHGQPDLDLSVGVMDMSRNDIRGSHGNRLPRGLQVFALYIPEDPHSPRLLHGDSRDSPASILAWATSVMDSHQHDTRVHHHVDPNVAINKRGGAEHDEL